MCIRDSSVCDRLWFGNDLRNPHYTFQKPKKHYHASMFRVWCTNYRPIKRSMVRPMERWLHSTRNGGYKAYAVKWRQRWQSSSQDVFLAWNIFQLSDVNFYYPKQVFQVSNKASSQVYNVYSIIYMVRIKCISSKWENWRLLGKMEVAWMKIEYQ